MGVPVVKKCCCCSLETGTLIIGYIYTLCAATEVTLYCVLATLSPDDAFLTMRQYSMYLSAAGVSGVQLLCSTLLLVAAHKKLPSLTLPWTVVTGITTVIYLVKCSTAMVLMLQDIASILAVEIVLVSICLTRACISVYCILVVHSRHKELRHKEDEARAQRQALGYKSVHTEEVL